MDFKKWERIKTIRINDIFLRDPSVWFGGVELRGFNTASLFPPDVMTARCCRNRAALCRKISSFLQHPCHLQTPHHQSTLQLMTAKSTSSLHSYPSLTALWEAALILWNKCFRQTIDKNIVTDKFTIYIFNFAVLTNCAILSSVQLFSYSSMQFSTVQSLQGVMLILFCIFHIYCYKI